MTNEVKMVIGSWGSYNACNERALGSKWLNLDDYYDWDEVEEELKKEGFILDGMDEELFIQDIEGIGDGSHNWDYESPERLFNIVKDSGILEYESKYELLMAYLENNNLDDFFNLVELYGENWDQDMYLTEFDNWADYGRYLLEISEIHIPDDLEWYFDYEQYGEDQARYDNVYMTEYGILEIRK